MPRTKSTRGKENKTVEGGKTASTARGMKKRKPEVENVEQEAEAESRNETKKEKKMRNGDLQAKELPDASVGNGPSWRLPEGKTNDNAATDREARKRCEELLKQALASSTHTDVQLVFDDGTRLSGHWGMLCCACKVFEKTHSSGMEEARTREIRIVGVSRESFRGFMDWLYLGRAGKEVAGADGRELWLLAERYQVDGVKEWLMDVGLDAGGARAAAQYALEGDGEGREDLVIACRRKACAKCLSVIDDARLRGASVFAGPDPRLANPNHVCAEDTTMYKPRPKVLNEFIEFGRHGQIALTEQGGRVLLALVDSSKYRVSIFDADTGACVRTVGTRGKGKGQFERPNGVAFNKQGDLIVCDSKLCRIQVFDSQGAHLRTFKRHGKGEGRFASVAVNDEGNIIVLDEHNNCVQVYSEDGTFIRSFGSSGRGTGQFDEPMNVAAGPDGRIAVVDFQNQRVQVFDKVGVHIVTIGKRDDESEGAPLYLPNDVCFGPHGEIMVSDLSYNEVRVFSLAGKLIQRMEALKDGVHVNLGIALDSTGRVYVGNDWEDENKQITVAMIGRLGATKVGKKGRS